MFKIFLLFFVVSCTLVHGFNYGENQASSNYNIDQQAQLRNGFTKPLASTEQKWNNGFNVQPEQQDGYIIRQPQLRPQNPSILQRNFIRSESARRTGGALPNTGFVQVNNGDVALHNERTGQRLLSSGSLSGGVSKNVPPSLLLKNDNPSSSSQIQTNDALPLSSLSRISRPQSPQSHGSLSGFNRHQTLEQMLQHKSADKFLGHGFIQQQLLSQKDKFLTVHGKEEREINGTIEVKKNGLVNANIEEIKDARFSVMDRKNNKVGDVTMHRDVEKHLKMTENNGVTNVELEKNSNAELNVERDINFYPRLRYGQNSNLPNPSHKVRVHLEQNQQSRAQVEIAKNQIQTATLAPENNRFRRDIANQQDEAFNVTNVQNGIQRLANSPFVKTVGSVFGNLASKVGNVLSDSKSKVCKVLINNSEKYKTKLEQLANNSSIDFSKEMNSTSNPEEPFQPKQEQGKMKILFNNIQKNTLKIMSSLTNKAIQMCSNNVSTQDAYVTQLPNGDKVIVFDASYLKPTVSSTTVESSISSIP